MSEQMFIALFLAILLLEYNNPIEEPPTQPEDQETLDDLADMTQEEFEWL
jgi:hypothetical protein